MNSATLGVSRVRNSSANWLWATIFAVIVFLIGSQLAWGGVTGSISGVVRDSSGATVPAVPLTNGWTVSGVTHFSTGLPVFMLENDDNSLLGTSGSGPIQLPIDTPNYTPGPLRFTNPRSRQPYFNTSLFSDEALGQLGNSPRFFFHGPGLNNWDINLQKITKITESMNVAFRAEFFNAFNHAQFGLPDGDITDSTFGLVTGANPPRIIQFGLKFQF
jgi:hypothetical protein